MCPKNSTIGLQLKSPPINIKKGVSVKNVYLCGSPHTLTRFLSVGGEGGNTGRKHSCQIFKASVHTS